MLPNLCVNRKSYLIHNYNHHWFWAYLLSEILYTICILKQWSTGHKIGFLEPLWKMIWFHWSPFFIYHLQASQCLTFHKSPYYLLINQRKSIIWQEIATVDFLLCELVCLYNFSSVLQTTSANYSVNFNFWNMIKTEVHYQMMTSCCQSY